MRVNFLLGRVGEAGAPVPAAPVRATAPATGPARAANLSGYLARIAGAVDEVRSGLAPAPRPALSDDPRMVRMLGIGGLLAGCAIGAAALGSQGFLLTAAAQALAFLGGLLFSRSGDRQRLEEFERLRFQAMHDPLTGLRNRGSIEEELARAASGTYAVVLGDVDHFKRLNDTYGHPAGDRVLQEVASRARLCADLVGRYGGEEFLIVLPGAGRDEARLVAEALRLAVAGQPFDTGRGLVPVTMSLGAASSEGRPGADLVSLADEALYRAKSAGRNRVEVG